MSRKNRQLGVGVAALVWLLATAASAQTQAAPPTPEVRTPDATAPTSATPPGTETRAHMRSSHTVDVIAPGEKVDTILGRMRPERPAPPPRAETVRPPPGADTRGSQSASVPGRTEQARPLENERDNERDVGRSSPRTDRSTPSPYLPPRTPPHR